jgi:hypothetical protein
MILLHIRMAIGGVRRDKGLSAEWQEGDLAVEDNLTFSLDLFLRRSPPRPGTGAQNSERSTFRYQNCATEYFTQFEFMVRF